MVRLKEELFPILDNDEQVSIPYGSIKSQLRNEYEPQKIVSIPYGSIKRSYICFSEGN